MVKIPRFVSSRTPEMISRCLLLWRLQKTRTCTQTQITLLPMKYREVVNLSGLAVYKGSTQQIIMIMVIATRK